MKVYEPDTAPSNLLSRNRLRYFKIKPTSQNKPEAEEENKYRSTNTSLYNIYKLRPTTNDITIIEKYREYIAHLYYGSTIFWGNNNYPTFTLKEGVFGESYPDNFISMRDMLDHHFSEQDMEAFLSTIK